MAGAPTRRVWSSRVFWGWDWLGSRSDILGSCCSAKELVFACLTFPFLSLSPSSFSLVSGALPPETFCAVGAPGRGASALARAL